MNKATLDNRRIVYLPIGQVKEAPWNPSRRTNNTVTRGLVKSMRESGFWWYMPLVLGRDGTLADGHRRLSAAKELRLTEVPCVHVDKSADVLWAEINGRRRTVSKAETLEAVTLGLQAMPDEHSAEVTEFIRIIGMDEARQPYMIGVAPGILTTARKAARYMGYERDEEMLKRLVVWFRKHRMQNPARIAMNAEVDPALLFDYIIADKPLPPLRLAI